MTKSKDLIHSGREGLDFRKKERVYPTGCTLLNMAFGVVDPITKQPGIPAATVVEAFGPNASLKTALWESLAANIHKMDKQAKVLAILSEEPEYERFESVGIDLDRIFCWTYYNLNNPDLMVSAEEGLDLVNTLVSEDTDYKLVVVDSIKGLISTGQTFDKKGALKGLEEGDPVAARANLINRFTGKFAAANKARIKVAPGAKVGKGQPVAVMEAMKMEHTLTAPRDGTVAELRYAVGDQVLEGEELLRLEPLA